MPNYDGTGPLKRGRVIGRGMGTCRHSTEDCVREKKDTKNLIGTGRRPNNWKGETGSCQSHSSA
jgi:hypothetical protein